MEAASIHSIEKHHHHLQIRDVASEAFTDAAKLLEEANLGDKVGTNFIDCAMFHFLLLLFQARSSDWFLAFLILKVQGVREAVREMLQMSADLKAHAGALRSFTQAYVPGNIMTDFDAELRSKKEQLLASQR